VTSIAALDCCTRITTDFTHWVSSSAVSIWTVRRRARGHRVRAALVDLCLWLLGVIGLTVACSGLATPSNHDFPAFPSSATLPSSAELATMLARGLPERDRAAATALLVDEILPWDLRDLPRDPSAAPSPRAIVHAAYDTLANQLGEVAPERRLGRLATFACLRRGSRITRRATALAVARYVADHGRPRSNMVVGYLGEAHEQIAMTPDERTAEADRVEHDLAGFEHDAQADADCHARLRIPLIHARLALDAARSGRFEAATGPLYVFLRYAGQSPQHLEPH
jgi:hypothetical protein